MTEAANRISVSEEDALRADLYDFLGAMLASPPSPELLKKAEALTGDDTDIGRGVRALATIARASDSATVRHEFEALFIGLGRGELLPYASYYLTGFLNEKPLARLRQTTPFTGSLSASICGSLLEGNGPLPGREP